MEDRVGLNRLSFFGPKKKKKKEKVSCANEEMPSSAFIAQEAVGKRQNLRAGHGICASWGGDKAKVSRSRVESFWLKIPSPLPLHIVSVTQG